MVDNAEALLSAGNNYPTLYIIKPLVHLHRLNMISRGTPKMQGKWYNFTKMVNERCVSFSLCIQHAICGEKKGARTRCVKESQPERLIRAEPYWELCLLKTWQQGASHQEEGRQRGLDPLGGGCWPAQTPQPKMEEAHTGYQPDCSAEVEEMREGKRRSGKKGERESGRCSRLTHQGRRSRPVKNSSLKSDKQECRLCYRKTQTLNRFTDSAKFLQACCFWPGRRYLPVKDQIGQRT